VSRVLLLATTTGYQVRAFGEAAERLGVDLVYATDRCHVLDDPWRDEAVAIRFYDEAGSADAILEAARARPIDGVLAVGDRPTVIGARVIEGLGLPGHSPAAATISRNKLLTRECLQAAGLPVPWFRSVPISIEPADLEGRVVFPCVLKPLTLSGSRGVIRANDHAELVAAFYRLRALLQSPDVRGDRTEANETALIEEFIAGEEFAVEGLMEHGVLRVLAIFDKPDPLDGPFFEETIYVTPSRAADVVQRDIVDAVRRASAAIGLRHGPVHAECRVNHRGVFVLEVAARPIGGLCARALGFEGVGRIFQTDKSLENAQKFAGKSTRPIFSLEELLLRHALGERVDGWTREPGASGVMMIPIPRRGVLRGVSGTDEARALPNIEDVRITAKPDQLLVPLPEGASYLGFIFSRAPAPADVERALREAHARLDFTIDPEMRVLQSLHG
jgi:ATP-grasp domain-containing protein/L-aminoacid ligase-like protein